MTVLKKIKFHLDVMNYFKELLFYNTYIEKLKIKRLKNTGLPSELPFYEELSVVKTNKAFIGYGMTCKVEFIDKKNPLSRFKARKSNIKDFLNYLLDETKGFKYQITVKILLK